MAPQYDRFNRWASLGLDSRWRRRTIQSIDPHDEGALLDVATGTGELTVLAARMRPHLSRIEGVDFSSPMLALARMKTARMGLKGRVHFTEGRAEALPYPDGTFTWLTSAFAMRHVQTRLEQVLGEMARVLTPGGHVLILEFARPQWRLARAIHGAYVSRALPRLGHWLMGETLPFQYLHDSIQGFLDPSAFIEALTKAGFLAVQATPLTWGTVMLYHGRKP